MAEIDNVIENQGQPPVEGEGVPPIEGEGVEPIEGEGVEPEWQPNYKFKVLDEEHEIEDWAKPFCTKDTNDKVRELYEKAYGLDHVKWKNKELTSKYDSLNSEYEDFQAGIQAILALRGEPDLGPFFDRVKLSREAVLRWAVEQAKLSQLPPEQKAAYNERDELRSQVIDLKSQLEGLSKNFETRAVQSRQAELGQVLSEPNISPLVEAFDNRVGKKGSFYNQVVRHAKAEWEQTGRDLTPREAVDQVVSLLGLTAQPHESGTPNGSGTKPTVVEHEKPTVLPNVGKSPQHPVAKKISSTDDLRRLADKMSG